MPAVTPPPRKKVTALFRSRVFRNIAQEVANFSGGGARFVECKQDCSVPGGSCTCPLRPPSRYCRSRLVGARARAQYQTAVRDSAQYRTVRTTVPIVPA
eukprot:2006501-Rhodomonas_salina.2